MSIYWQIKSEITKYILQYDIQQTNQNVPLTSTTSVPPFWIRSVKSSTSFGVKEHDGLACKLGKIINNIENKK